MASYSITYGALLLGALFASAFSGFVALQSVLYFKLFPEDKSSLKGLVLVVWVLDLTHSSLIWASLWDYMVTHFANASYGDHIPNSIALTVIFTAIVTLMTHCFFAHRIYQLSRHKWYLAAPVVILSFGRLGCAIASGAEMMRLQSFTHFKAKFEYRFLFSFGLALSSGVDILVTTLLFLLLRGSKSEFSRLNNIIDASIMYTFEIGSLTTAATITAMTCWLAMDNGLIFLGLHFAIGKLYANSLLTSLNTRQRFRGTRAAVTAIDWFNIPQRSPIHSSRDRSEACAVQVDVSKSVQYDIDP